MSGCEVEPKKSLTDERFEKILSNTKELINAAHDLKLLINKKVTYCIGEPTSKPSEEKDKNPDLCWLDEMITDQIEALSILFEATERMKDL